MKLRARAPSRLLALTGALGLLSCATHSESAGRDGMTADVGVYTRAPDGVGRPRVGVPPFQVTTERTWFAPQTDPNSLASDQMATLLSLSDRFAVVERGQLEQLLREQDLEGIVKPGELARPGQVRGVDYLLIGKVTNLRVKSERSGTAFGTGNIFSGMLPVDSVGVAKSNVIVSTDCGVDIRLVDPTTGEVALANFSEFKRADSAEAYGLGVGSASASSSADIEISEDDKGKILRLALDDALRKSIPKVDALLKSRFASAAAPASPASSSAAPATAAATAVDPAKSGSASPAVAGGFCAQCGKQLAAKAKFCGGCGAKADG